MRTTNPREIAKEMAVSRETADDISVWRSAENRAAAAEWKKSLPALRARCDEVYEAALAGYREKHPSGKNGTKHALRKARDIWAGYTR